MTTTTSQISQVSKLHAALEQINPQTVQVLAADRHIPRKQQAALARDLFRRLGLKGVSVTAPCYSMAHSVDIVLPKREDFRMDQWGQVADYLNDPAAVANRAAEDKVRAILAAAFPNHDDRSDGQSDHYDFKWSFE